MIVIDKLCYNSRLRYVNTSEKFAFSLLTLCFCIISRSILMALIVLLVNGILTVGIGRIPFFRYRRLLLVPLVFLLLSTIALLINVSPVPLDGYALPLGSIYITASRSSLFHALQLICTAMASVSCLYFLALNTTMTDILDQFRRLHVPGLLVELMLLIYRYIFVLLDVAYHIITSQHSRLGNKDFKTACKSFGGMVSVLFVRSMKKAGALYDAMESRCYDGTIRVLTEDHPPKSKEIFWIILFESFLLILTIWSKIR